MGSHTKSWNLAGDSDQPPSRCHAVATAGNSSARIRLAPLPGAKQKVTFTGSLTDGPTEVAGQPFPRMHEGHSGWTISQLSPLVPTPALDGKPNIILLHIGTNDSSSQGYAYMAGIWYAAIKDLLSR